MLSFSRSHVESNKPLKKKCVCDEMIQQVKEVCTTKPDDLQFNLLDLNGGRREWTLSLSSDFLMCTVPTDTHYKQINVFEN